MPSSSLPALAAALLCAALGGVRPALAQRAEPADSAAAPDSAPASSPSARGASWSERLSLRGYAQVRYNRLLETNPELTCSQCDRSIGRDGGLFIRRARVVLSGELSDRVSVYVQPDFASDAGGTINLGQLRDAYADIFLDPAKAFRVRLGQSKIPYGWENLQSSSDRIPLDRADATNSALPNERDVGALLYWAPGPIRARFRMLADSELKGSGDYGVVGIGAFNGQGANRSESNGNLHTVLRVSYPFLLPGGQVVEAGVQGYTGRFVLPESQRTADVAGPAEFTDRRAAATLVVYPQPFGVQAEWNVGRGPEADPTARAIASRSLSGGYVQAMYRARVAGRTVVPFARAQRYDGGKKLETDARSYRVRELEIGVEWLPAAAIELTAMYTISDRRFEDVERPVNRQRGRLLRLQAQVNF
jgi:hypothetical protein